MVVMYIPCCNKCHGVQRDCRQIFKQLVTTPAQEVKPWTCDSMRLYYAACMHRSGTPAPVCAACVKMAAAKRLRGPRHGLQNTTQMHNDDLDMLVSLPLSVRRLLARGVNTAADNRVTALHWAADHGDREFVERLLQAGADVKALTEEGETPLHCAAAAGHAHLLPLLLTPTTKDLRNQQHYTALQLAVEGDELEAAKVLVAAGASLEGVNAPTPFQLAIECMAEGGSTQMPLMLLKAIVYRPNSAALLLEAVRPKDDEGKTALHHAAAAGCQELVAKLLEAGAHKSVADDAGATPLWLAAAAGHAHLVPLLATPGSIYMAAEGGSTPLHAAADKGYASAVAALLAAGAKLHLRDRQGCAALAVAAGHGHTRVMALLLEALAKECGLHKGQQQLQQQQKKQQQQQGQARLADLVATAAVPLAKELKDAPRCAQLLGVVLDVLGTAVAGQVCTQVQRQLKADWHASTPDPYGSQVSRLAEALLLGWVGAEERLHAARQPLVARLQRLVVQNQQQQQQGMTDEEDGVVLVPWLLSKQETTRQRLEQLVKEAAQAAADDQEAKALGLLSKFAALHLQEQQQQQQKGSLVQALNTSGAPVPAPLAAGSSRSSTDPAQAGYGDHVRAILRVFQSGLMSTAYCSFSLDYLQGARSFRPPGVYTTFLAAWVGARRQLQQLPQEVAATVVAAVKAAQQQQHLQQQQQQQLQQQQQQQQPQGEDEHELQQAWQEECQQPQELQPQEGVQLGQPRLLEEQQLVLRLRQLQMEPYLDDEMLRERMQILQQLLAPWENKY